MIAAPPGRTIDEQLKNRGITYKEFASSMEMTEEEIKHLLNGETTLTTDIVYRLEKVLSIPSKFWIKLEGIYREKLKNKYTHTKKTSVERIYGF